MLFDGAESTRSVEQQIKLDQMGQLQMTTRAAVDWQSKKNLTFDNVVHHLLIYFTYFLFERYVCIT